MQRNTVGGFETFFLFLILAQKSDEINRILRPLADEKKIIKEIKSFVPWNKSTIIAVKKMQRDNKEKTCSRIKMYIDLLKRQNDLYKKQGRLPGVAWVSEC